MKEIILGLLKSSNPVKLKKILLGKLCQNDNVIKSVGLNELISDIERMWSIQAWDEISSLNQAALIDELKLAYDHLNEHFDLLKDLFNSYAQFIE